MYDICALLFPRRLKDGKRLKVHIFTGWVEVLELKGQLHGLTWKTSSLYMQISKIKKMGGANRCHSRIEIHVLNGRKRTQNFALMRNGEEVYIK